MAPANITNPTSDSPCAFKALAGLLGAARLLQCIAQRHLAFSRLRIVPNHLLASSDRLVVMGQYHQLKIIFCCGMVGLD